MSGGLSLSSEFPVAQPGFPRRGEFRHGFDIVTAPFMPKPYKIDSLTEQYDPIQNIRNIKVSI